METQTEQSQVIISIVLMPNVFCECWDETILKQLSFQILSVAATKFEDESSNQQSISKMFARKSNITVTTEATQSNDANETGNNVTESNAKDTDNVVTAEDLVPSLKEFDPSILSFLPLKLRESVKKRVEYLKKNTKATFFDKKSVKECERENVPSTSLEDTTTNESSKSEVNESADTHNEDSVSSNKNLEENDPNSPNFDDDFVKCEKCKKLVSPFEMPEHLDFHLAQELQKEIRNQDRQSNLSSSTRSNIKTISNNVAKGTKRKNASKASSESDKKQRNIQSFFNN